MTLDQFTEQTFSNSDFISRPRIICNDGFNMSVQASTGHYCIPRKSIKHYEAMEIGYPSEREDLLIDYAEEPERPTDTVYGYVPVQVIQEVIEKHGGINEFETFKSKPIN